MKWCLCFDSSVYSLDAIKRSVYDFSEIYVLTVTKKSGDICVEGENKSVDEEKFKCAVLDHQLRIDTEKKYEIIRALLVAQAIDPQENLDQILFDVEKL